MSCVCRTIQKKEVGLRTVTCFVGVVADGAAQGQGENERQYLDESYEAQQDRRIVRHQIDGLLRHFQATLMVEVVCGSPVDGNTQRPGGLAHSVFLDTARSRELDLESIPIPKVTCTAATEGLLKQVGRFRIVLNVFKEATNTVQSVS